MGFAHLLRSQFDGRLAVMTLLHSIELEIFADYFQFYLQDEAVDEDWGTFWTDETVERMLAVGECSVGIATARNMNVPVVVSVHDAAPEADFGEWELVNECSFRVRSGQMMVIGCTEGSPQERARFSLTPGSYRLRVSYVGLDMLSDDGLEGDDFYRLQIWPSPRAETRTLKERAGAAG
jgi:hypothetical protein